MNLLTIFIVVVCIFLLIIVSVCGVILVRIMHDISLIESRKDIVDTGYSGKNYKSNSNVEIECDIGMANIRNILNGFVKSNISIDDENI